MIRRLALLFAAIAISALVLEIGATLSYSLTHGEPFSKRAIQERLDLARASDSEQKSEDAPASALPGFVENKVLHPYLGYVFDPSVDRRVFNRFGLVGPDPLVEPAEDEITVAIFGGSVAMKLYLDGADALVRELRRDPRFQSRKIRVLSFGLSGYKQPQQLLALAFFLGLGAQIDVVINLDGLNEVALPSSENVPSRVYPFFPRAWNLYARSGLSSDEISQLVAIERVKQDRERLRELVARTPLRHSRFVLRLYDAMDVRYQHALNLEDAKLRERLASSTPSFKSSGPFEPYEDPGAVFSDLVDAWRSTSLQMARLGAANDIAYFHFLQPSQYVSGAKPLSEYERREAYAEGPFKHAVDEAYELLVEQGEVLQSQGVRFSDLTMLFEDEERSLYVDTCCHLNELGTELVAAEIARTILASDASPGSRVASGALDGEVR